MKLFKKFIKILKRKKQENFNKFLSNYLQQMNISMHHNYLSNCQVSVLSKISKPYSINDSSIEDYTYIASNSIVSLAEIGKFC